VLGVPRAKRDEDPPGESGTVLWGEKDGRTTGLIFSFSKLS
jgi:hypothetical protein